MTKKITVHIPTKEYLIANLGKILHDHLYDDLVFECATSEIDFLLSELLFKGEAINFGPDNALRQ